MSNDVELVDQVRDGNTTALARLHREYIRAVYWAVYRVLLDHAETDEVAQDVFLTLWEKRRSVQIHGESALPWLLVTARFLSLNKRRTRRRRAENEVALDFDIPLEADPLTRLQLSEEARYLREVVGKLAEEDRKIVSLCLVQGLTYKEAAARLDITHATVRNKLSRVRHRLQQTLRGEAGAS